MTEREADDSRVRGCANQPCPGEVGLHGVVPATEPTPGTSRIRNSLAAQAEAKLGLTATPVHSTIHLQEWLLGIMHTCVPCYQCKQLLLMCPLHL